MLADRRTLVVLAGLPTVLFDFSVFYTAGMGQKIPRWFPNEAHNCCCALTCFRSHLNQNSQRIMWFIPHNTMVIRFTYCLYRSIPFFSSINFPSKISCNTCLHGIRCNLLTSDAFVTRKRFSACWGNSPIPLERCLRHRAAHPFQML